MYKSIYQSYVTTKTFLFKKRLTIIIIIGVELLYSLLNTKGSRDFVKVNAKIQIIVGVGRLIRGFENIGPQRKASC